MNRQRQILPARWAGGRSRSASGHPRAPLACAPKPDGGVEAERMPSRFGPTDAVTQPNVPPAMRAFAHARAFGLRASSAPLWSERPLVVRPPVAGPRGPGRKGSRQIWAEEGFTVPASGLASVRLASGARASVFPSSVLNLPSSLVAALAAPACPPEPSAGGSLGAGGPVLRRPGEG